MICTRVIEEVKDYQSAIKMTCDILEEKGAVNHTYYQAILDNIEKYGGYFYLGKGICMPHARTEDGAIKSGMCVLMVKNKVRFFNNQVTINNNQSQSKSLDSPADTARYNRSPADGRISYLK